jgi:hypothetical protein
MTDEELKQLVASLAIAQKETDQQLKANVKQLKELGKQIGGLSNKFGSFTEGLALPSMTKILRERFKMEVISPSVRVSKNGIDAEIDVLAYANSEINEVYAVEVKSHLREEGINQLSNLMANFRSLFPEHADKKLYGILAAVDASEAMQEKVLAEGLYFAKIHDDQFSLCVPDGFEAHCFNPRQTEVAA